MGWKFDWVSSSGSRFNLDFKVSSGKDDESPGISIFYRDGEEFIAPTSPPAAGWRS